jgi:hypothetical protein
MIGRRIVEGDYRASGVSYVDRSDHSQLPETHVCKATRVNFRGPRRQL